MCSGRSRGEAKNLTHVWERKFTKLRGSNSNHMWVLDCLFPPCWAEVLTVQLASPHDLENIVCWVLHNLFINGLEQGGNRVLIKFAEDTKLGDVANIREDRFLIQEDVGRLEL